MHVITIPKKGIFPILKESQTPQIVQKKLNADFRIFDEFHGRECPCSIPDYILLNIGGFSYRMRSKTIYFRLNESRLREFLLMDDEEKMKKSDGFVNQSQEWLFQRSSKFFDPIFKFYATGKLHRPVDVCMEEFLEELDFWDIPHHCISPCCMPLVCADELMKPEKPSDPFENVSHGGIRKLIWNFCEGSGHKASNIFTVVSISFVLTSVLSLILGSIPEFQVEMKLSGKTEMVPHPFFNQLEYVCVAWFVLEFLVRFTVAANKLEFMRSLLNIIDILAIFPFFLELGLELARVDTSDLHNFKGALLVVRILRVLRVMRIFKLGRYSMGMKVFALTLQASANQLGMVFVVLLASIVLFSSIMYFVEKDEPTSPFVSIPAGFWWSIVTMTTVGYGDILPVSLIGKLSATCAIILGVLLLALPITIIVHNFVRVQQL